MSNLLEFDGEGTTHIRVEVAIREFTAIDFPYPDCGLSFADLKSIGESGVVVELCLVIIGIFLHQIIEHPEGFVATSCFSVVTGAADEQFIA